jgi:hypothetical protein
MLSIQSIIGAAAAWFAVLGSALPAQPKLSPRAVNLYNRQNAAATAAGINDIDILQL